MSLLPVPGTTDSHGTQHDTCIKCHRPIERPTGEELFVDAITGDDDCIQADTGRSLGVHEPDTIWMGE